MRTLTFLLCAVSLAGLVLAQPHAVLAAGKTHDLTGTVVSVDAQAKKITFKDDTGTSLTVPVLDKAVASLKTVKAGDKVTLTCQDNEKGDHEGVAAIKVAKK
jgi:Cu/Ag efflux protein CusF